MEFTRLADVEVVDTTTDNDKILIEQNGEIKRVPKTEVGGSGNILILESVIDPDAYEISEFKSNISFDETVYALNNHELTGVVLYFNYGGITMMDYVALAEITQEIGVPCLNIHTISTDTDVFWTANGVSFEPPTPTET